MRRILIAALLAALCAPLGGCALTYQAVALKENKTCGLDATTGLIDLGAAAVGALALYADDAPTGYYVADGVLVASAVVGFASAAVCTAREDDRRDKPRPYNPALNTIPDSVKLDAAPPDPDVRDATPEEMGLVPAKTAPAVPPPPTTEPTQ